MEKPRRYHGEWSALGGPTAKKLLRPAALGVLALGPPLALHSP